MTVAVFAATGWTGRLVCQALERHRVEFSIAGRNSDKLTHLRSQLASRPAVHIASAGDADSMARAFDDRRVVVNCAAPAIDTGLDVVAAAIAASCDYVDVSGEASFIADVRRVHDTSARARGVTVCPALAAKGALGDWGLQYAASLLPGRTRFEEAAVAYAHGLYEYFMATAGSVISFAGQGFLRARHIDGADKPLARRFAFPAPFDAGWALLVPGAEDVSVPRHLDVGRVESYISFAPGTLFNEPWARLSLLALPVLPAISRHLTSPEGRQQVQGILREPTRGRNTDTFAAAVEARSGSEVVRLGITARDAYIVTAEIVAFGVRRLLGKIRERAGVSSPAEIFPAIEALHALQDSGALRMLQAFGDP